MNNLEIHQYFDSKWK